MSPTRPTPPDPILEYQDFALGAQTPSALTAFLSLRPRLPWNTRVRQCIVYHTGDPANILASGHLRSYQRIDAANPAASVFRLSFTQHRGEGPEIAGYVTILPGSEPHCYRILTVSSTTFWVAAFRPLLRRLYPGTMPIFFRQSEIRAALLALQASLGADCQLLVTEATMKRMRRDDPRRHARLDTDRRWTELPINDAFDEALEEGHWFTSIHFKVRQPLQSGAHRDVAAGSIYKRGDLSYDSLHQEISAHLIPVLEQHGIQRLALLTSRGLRDRNYNPSNPIQISYDNDVFADLSEVHRFRQAMARYPNSTKAVLHGNPYYHASIADFADGSSFEVWILSAARVLIVPQAKSSEQAFERLISHVFSEFKEGTVSEYTA